MAKNTPAGRALSMAALGGGIAGRYAGYLLQSAFVGKDAREKKRKAVHAASARLMRDKMQTLRGPAMKLGQTLSLQAGVLPDEMLSELASLQMEAPGMHSSLVRVQIKAGLGGDPDDLFRSFSPEPAAAASLGQVHRAVLPNGDAVAVKVQYPAIRDAIDSDFSWFRTVSRPAQASGHVPRALIDELQNQIAAETDYIREAKNIEFFAKGLGPLPYVSVPRVYPEFSSGTVLTMSWMEGKHLDRLLAQRPSQAKRDLIGSHLFEMFYFQLLHLGALHADPHWGNYLLNEDGTIGLVDFGCVKYFTPKFVRDMRSVFLYDGDRHGPEFARLLEKRHGLDDRKLTPAARRALVAFAENFYKKVYPPNAADQDTPFDFGDAAFLRDYMRESTNLFRSRGVLTAYLFLARAEMGLYHTLHKLRARVHTSAIVRKHMAE